MFRDTFVIASNLAQKEMKRTITLKVLKNLHQRKKNIWWTAGRESGHKEIDACGNPGGKF